MERWEADYWGQACWGVKWQGHSSRERGGGWGANHGTNILPTPQLEYTLYPPSTCIIHKHISYLNMLPTSTCFHVISISTCCHTMYPNTLYPYDVFYPSKYQYNVSMQNTLPQQEFIWCIQVKHISIQCKYSTNVSYSTNTKIMYPTLLRTHKIYLNSTSKCKMHFVETSFHTSYPPQHLHLFIWQTLPQ